MKRVIAAFVFLLPVLAFAAEDRHVYLNQSGGGTQLDDCPNPVHNIHATAGDTSELVRCTDVTPNRFYCTGAICANDVSSTGCCKSWTRDCVIGSRANVVNGDTVDVDGDGVGEKVYGQPQACVWNMGLSDSCEIHAGTYTFAGAQCGANCSDFTSGTTLGTCYDWNCWFSSVWASGFGPNQTGAGYGTSGSPGWLRGAVMNTSTDTWDANGDKVADGNANLAVVLSGDRTNPGVFDKTDCVGSAACTGDIYHALIVGCGGTNSDAFGQINCPSAALGASEEYVKIDADADGVPETAVSTLGVGVRNVNYFQVKDIEFTRYNQGAGAGTGVGNASVDCDAARFRTANINLNGNGATTGLKLVHIFFHDYSYGVNGAVQDQCNQGGISDMRNQNCLGNTEIKDSYIYMNNKSLFVDEGSLSPAKGCTWNIHDNRFLIDVQGDSAASFQPPSFAFLKAYDYHPVDGRPKQFRFWNNEVVVKKVSTGSATNARFLVLENIGNSGGNGLGEIWFYGNIFRNSSDVTTTMGGGADASFYPSSCSSASPSGNSWRAYWFNNTWDGFSSGKAFDMEGMCRSGSSTGELFVERNNVEINVTGEFGSPNETSATLKDRAFNANTDGSKCLASSSGYFVCGTDPVTNSGLAYYAPRPGGALDGDGTCNPDGDISNGVDWNFDGSNDVTWTDLAGHPVDCTLGGNIAIGAVQIAGVVLPTSGRLRGARIKYGRLK